MKTIGIKLADGSFYPVMQEGQPCKKTLGLTTVKDNQTRIVVDLYRSKTNSMEDAEYVDTLQIDGLVSHPNGEADISLNIGLDENNELHAELNDPETGSDSTVTVTLVSRTLEERLEPTNFEVVGEVTDTIDEIKMPFENSEENTEEDSKKDDGFAEKASGAAVGGGLLAAAAMYKKQEESEQPKDEEIQNIETDYDSFIINDAFSVPEEENSFEAQNDSVSAENGEESGGITEDADFAEPVLPSDEIENTNDETVSEISEPNQENLSESDNFEIPESSDDILGDDLNFDESTVSSEEDDFQIPDMNESVSDDDIFDSFDSEENQSEQNQEPSEPTPANGISFTGLYDKETFEENTENAEENADDVKKKTKVPVIICIICAIICLIATALILFIVPSKYNLLNKKTPSEENPVEIPLETEPEEIETEIEPEEIEEPEESVIQEAQEEEVIVVSEPEQVEPEVPETPEKVPEDITYKIKWGDTLWDIASTYYKNPWKYKKIARDNNIKNPDYIISGRKIILKSPEVSE